MPSNKYRDRCRGESTGKDKEKWRRGLHTVYQLRYNILSVHVQPSGPSSSEKGAKICERIRPN